MRVAYADPPYPGQSRRHYADHPDYAGEVDHCELIAQLLADYDCWALSTSSAAVQAVLALCPRTVRVGVWYRPNSEPPGNRGRWHWSWEPVIFHGWRGTGPTVRDVLTLPKVNSEIVGQKPRLFCDWVFRLLGLLPEDELFDLFPGSGAVAWAWDGWRSQLSLPVEASA